MQSSKSGLKNFRSEVWCSEITPLMALTSGHEGRIGMASLTLKENMDFDGKATYQHVKNSLPSYARPRFIRIQVMTLGQKHKRQCDCWNHDHVLFCTCGRTLCSWQGHINKWRWSLQRRASTLLSSRTLCSTWRTARAMCPWRRRYSTRLSREDSDYERVLRLWKHCQQHSVSYFNLRKGMFHAEK